MAKYCSDKDINKDIGKLIKLGWTYEHSTHIKLRPPVITSLFLSISGSPSDNNACRAFR